MELTLILQIIFIFVIFIVNLVCVLLPLKVIPRDPSTLSGSKSKRIISFCNCFSGGVFLGVCFLQLTPYINAKLEHVFRRTDTDPKFCLPTTQCIVVLGFFLTLLIEQVVKKVQGTKKCSQVKETQETQVVPMPPIPQHAWLPSSSDLDTGSTGSEDSEDTNASGQEKKRMLKHKQKKKTTKKPFGILSSSHQSNKKPSLLNDSTAVTFSTETHSVTLGHSEDHQGHGHSHIGDLMGEEFGLRCMLLLAALSLHSFFEGLAVGLQDEVPRLVNLFVGVAVHECLVAFAIGINLAQQKLKLSTLIKLCLFFSATIPVGMALGLLIGTAHNSLAGEISSAVIQGIAAGTFYHVIFLEILPGEINSQGDSLWKVLFFFVGFGVITALSFSVDEGH